MRLFSFFRLLLLMAFFAATAFAQAPDPDSPLSQAVTPANDPPQSFRVLCYHDIRDKLRESFQQQPERTAVDTQDFVRQLSWINENGFHPVSLQQIIDARAGRKPLPDKAILLTFDDGYKSVYTKVFPLLKLFNFPAVIAIVGEWIETPSDMQVKYGDGLLPRSQFVTWNEIREMVDSGLVEVASHSHDMHHGIQANPQGNLIPAAIARYYWSDKQQYENDQEYAARVKTDLKRNADLLESRLHRRPRAMVWPYGAYNLDVAQWAADSGMAVGMNLDEGANTPDTSLREMRRNLILFDSDLSHFVKILGKPGYDDEQDRIERVVHIDLDYVYDPDPQRQEENLSQLLDRIQRLHPSTVYLQAYADSDGDGVADAVYFPNRHLPMRADLFSRAAWQLRTRTGVRVYAWMPVMAFKLPDANPAAKSVVQVAPDAPEAARQRRYRRLSIFDPLARKTILEIYEDLAKHAVFSGVLFHDDATFSDYEDASAAALAVYRDEWKLPPSVESIRKDPNLRRIWMERKTAYLNDFTLTLIKKLREYHPALHTARNLYASAVLTPESEEWLAQNFQSFLRIYDFTAVMAMPYMEGAADPDRWLKQLIGKVKEVPGALRSTVFELQAQDWKNKQPIPSQTLARQLHQLHVDGAVHFGYYPDDFIKNQPDESILKTVISTETYPRR